ncbi:MAG: hypothetical protein JXC32_13280 [Anaerolineae bacterium]|nr:hypothetical protein [Anaerolineae bacterium]
MRNLARWGTVPALLVSLLFSGCGPATTAWFTYSTYDGAVWQIDVEGNRIQLLPSDSVQKWHLEWSDDRQWLAYVALEYPQPGVRTETLFVVDREGQNDRKIAGPHLSIYYEWENAHHMRLGIADASSPGQPQERDWFLVDVETSAVVEIETEWPTLTPLPEPRLIESPDGQWAVQSMREESSRTFYLLDQHGNRVAPIYEQPAEAAEEFTIWSRDSRWFLYMPLRSSYPIYTDFYVLQPESLAATRLSNCEERGDIWLVLGLQWSPNGEWLLFSLTDSTSANQLCVIHFDDEPDLRCFNVQRKSGDYVWSSDSRFVAFVSSVETDLCVLEVSSGEIRNLTNDGDSQVEESITSY